MCGLAGIFPFWNGVGGKIDCEALSTMTDRLTHRGPDGRAVWSDGTIGLGHRRLSIIDLPGGAQPIANESGEVRVIFNGEIYNHRDLRRELEARGHVFATRCDTEVLVHLYEEHGPDLVERLNGMFAFALWDARRERLVLARDRLGIKPLYYHADAGGLVFASELGSLRAHPAVGREIDPEALHLYLQHQYVPAPHTLITGVRKLRPAELLIAGRGGEIERRIYWRPAFEPKLEISKDEALERFDDLLSRAVERRLMSDVPLGAFLSGGLDSSTLVWWMRRHWKHEEPLRTFCLGFEEASWDERAPARAVAERLGTEHHEAVATPARALEALDEVIAHLDEPLADASAIPTWLISRLARERVKVVLSGDGGDELLAGYERHLANSLDRAVYARLPAVLRRRAAPFFARLPASRRKKGLADLLRRFAEGAAKDPRAGQMRWQTFLPAPDWLERLYTPEMRRRAAETDPLAAILERRHAGPGAPRGRLDEELALELGLYLPDDILMKVDRMSMAVSLEARVPFLDHELVEFTARLPERYKWRLGRGKRLLRRAMRDRLPPEIIRRRKQGFGVPVKRWLRGELYERVRESFRGPALRDDPWLEPAGLLDMLEEHRRGRADHAHPLWAFYVLSRWLETRA